MLFTTASEWAALALTLLAGWFLGLASSSGGRKWRDRYAAERDAHAVARRDSEARLAAADARTRDLERDHGRLAQSDARIAELERDRASLTQAQARIAELERENARLSQAAPLAASTAPIAPTTTAHPAATARPAMPLTQRVVGDRPRRGWFDWSPGADPRARRS